MSARDARLCGKSSWNNQTGRFPHTLEGGDKKLEQRKLGHFNFMNEFHPD